MKSGLRAFPVCVGALLGSCYPVSAKDLSALVSASSNFYYRGYTKSGNGPTVRGNVDYQPTKWFYIGTWISRVNFKDQSFADRSNIEFYPYLGFHFKLHTDWSLETSAARYFYDGKLFGRNSDYSEYSISLHFSDLATAQIDFAPNLYGRQSGGLNYVVSGRYPITEKWVVSSGIGYNQATPVLHSNAIYWNIGISWFFKHGALDLRYVDLSETSHSNKFDDINLPELGSKFVFSLSAGF
ncbi:MAG: TorF family putative porin [Gammaproteobacteria bacterium]